MRNLATIGILVATAIIVPIYLWAGLTWFDPVEYGVYWEYTAPQRANVTYLERGSSAARAGVVIGARVLAPPPGDVLRGFRLGFPRVGDEIRIATPHGPVTVRAAPREERWLGIAAVTTQVTAVVLILFATMLYVRRPGTMAFALWLYAVASINLGQLAPLIAPLPSALGLALWLPLVGYIGCAFALPLIPFALRFPDGSLSPHSRWAEVTAWTAMALVVVAGALVDASALGGNLTQGQYNAFIQTIPALSLFVAAVILVRRYVGRSALERAQTAWALAGFTLLIAADIASTGSNLLRELPLFDPRVWDFIFLALLALANLAPLLAIYPILRHRLFDLGFVVNRAALYSLLDRRSARDARRRELVRAALRDRTSRGHRSTTGRDRDRARLYAGSSGDAAITRAHDFSRSLCRRSRARSDDQRLRASRASRGDRRIGHPRRGERALVVLGRDFSAPRQRVETAGEHRLGWRLIRGLAARRSNRPTPARRSPRRCHRPDALESGGLAVVAERARPRARADARQHPGRRCLLRRYRNGTEIDPQETTLLRRLCDAACAAYRTAELQSELSQLKGRLAVLEASPAT